MEPVFTEDYSKVYGLDATNGSGPWDPVPVHVVDSENRHPSRGEDELLWLGPHVLVLRERALEILSDDLDGHGEFLELFDPLKNESLWMFYPHLRDVLDIERSQLRFSMTDSMQTDSMQQNSGQQSSGQQNVAAITHHAFRRDEVAGLNAFRVPQVPTLYLAEDVVMTVRAANLRGASFSVVWDPVLSRV